MSIEEQRYQLLTEYTRDETVISELLAYTQNKFVQEKSGIDVDDKTDPSILDFEMQVREADKQGVFNTLKSNWVQFQFPIQENISTQEEYRKATLRGTSVKQLNSATGLQLRNLESLELHMYKSVAGTIPVLTVSNEEDFYDIIRALCHKNEPVHIPLTMGAAMINGINNWNRIHELKEQWKTATVSGNWGSYFKNHILPKPELYKDKIIVLSTKPYSNVSATKLDLEVTKWSRYSAQIRLAHECFHLFTLKQYGHMANNMHDELIADYYGIRTAFGKFNKEWFLWFVGLESFPKYRQGSRFENYLGTPRISEKAFDILKVIIKKAVDNLYQFDSVLDTINAIPDMTKVLKTLCSFDLITLSSADAPGLLLSQYEKMTFVTNNQKDEEYKIIAGS